MHLILASLFLFAPGPELAQSYCETRAFHAAFRAPEFTLNLEGQYDARFSLSSLRQLPVDLPGIGAAIATLGWGGEPCLFVQRGTTLLRLCFQTPAMAAAKRSMTMQMMPGPEAAAPPPGPERGFISAFEAEDRAALVRHRFSRTAVEVVQRLDGGEVVGVTRRARVAAIRAAINGERHLLDGQRLPAALGDEVVVRIIVEARETRCALNALVERSVDPKELSATLEQGPTRWTGVRDGASLRFDLGTITSLRRHRYRIEVDGKRLSGELLHRYGQPGEARLRGGTEQTALPPPRGLTTAALREQVLREIEASYDSDRHRLGVAWLQPGLRAELRRRRGLDAEKLALAGAPPERVLLHRRGPAIGDRHRTPLRHAALRLSGPYADTWNNRGAGPDVIWEDDLAYSLFSAMRFGGDDAARVERWAGFLAAQIAKQAEPTHCTLSKNRQCAIDTESAEGHAWALLAFDRLAAGGDREAGAVAARIVEHLGQHHRTGAERADASAGWAWQARVQEQLLLATALRQHPGVAANLVAAAEKELLGLVERGYPHLRLGVMADLHDYLSGSAFLLGVAP